MSGETKASILGDATAKQIRDRVRQETREGKDVEAYEWTHETPDRAMAADEVWAMCCKIRRKFQEYLSRPFAAGEPVPSDEAVQEQLCREDPDIALFARPNDHKSTFMMVASRETTVEHMTQLATLLHIRSAAENRLIQPKQADQLAQGYIKKVLDADKVQAFLVKCDEERARRHAHDPKGAVKRFRGRK